MLLERNNIKSNSIGSIKSLDKDNQRLIACLFEPGIHVYGVILSVTCVLSI